MRQTRTGAGAQQPVNDIGYRHDYTKAELGVWAGRIRASGAIRAWVYFNNDRDGYAVKNARELLRQLRRPGEGREREGASPPQL